MGDIIMKNKKIVRLLLVLFCVMILIVIGIFIYFNFFKEIKNSEFEEKINIYGLNKIYNNQSSKPNENVTKIEAIKLVIAATNNTLNFDSVTLGYEGNEEEKILQYAYKSGIVSTEEVDKNNCKSKAKIIDLIKYISRAKYYILKKDYLEMDNILLKDYEKYNEEEKIYISDLLAKEIIENNDYKLNANSNLKKHLCNKYIVNYINKMNLLFSSDNLVTESDKLPENANEYPYIISGVEKEVYEQNYIIDNKDNFLNPSEFYTYRKDYYDLTIKRAEEYYNAILNVSYETINYNDMYNKLESLVTGKVNEKQLKDYIEYVKNNKIVIEGTAKAQVPCIYNDGGSCRIRMLLNFDIKNSLTRSDILYMDLSTNSKKNYGKNNYNIYIDAVMGYVLGSEQVYVTQKSVSSMLLDMSKDEIVVK